MMARRSRSARFLRFAALLAMLLAAGFTLYLDFRVRSEFEGRRFALPARIYARPLELHAGLKLPLADVADELREAGYREGAGDTEPGWFVRDGNALDIGLRPFVFWDGAQPARRIRVSFEGGRVESLVDAEGRNLDLARLEPLPIGGIYPANNEDRVLVRLAEVPRHLIDALIAIEDRSYYSHLGFDPRGVARAVWSLVSSSKRAQGGSTLTQQLVKNFFLTSKRDWQRKAKEACMALLLEAHYSKDEILEAYLNEIHLGQDGDRAVHGFGLGSRFYFNKPVSELRPHEVALLVGVVKGSSQYNPRRNPKTALARRDLVLKIFRDEELISEGEYQDALKEPLGIAGGVGGSVARYPAFVDLVKRQLKGQYQDTDLVNEGLRIFTTLDPRAQEVLERDLSEGLAKLEVGRKQKPGMLQTAGVVTSVDGGEVLAVVGGRDVRYSGFNRALDSRRAIGSLAKPFVFLSAMQNQPDRFNLHTILDDVPIEIKLPNQKLWAPKNYDHKLHGPQPLYMALAQSYNLPTIRAGLEVGAASVLETMRATGYSGDAKPVPSVFLGAVDIAPIEVAQMYGTLAAGGYQTRLSSIRSVTTKEGTPLNRYPIKVKQTLPEGPTYLINWGMTKVIELGTARSALSAVPPGTALAGKTGTTDDMRDSWFAGFSADRVTVVWMGRDDYKPMGFTGASGALVLWTRVMKDLHVRGLDMIPPPDVEEQLTDTYTGLKADEGCQSVVLLPYLSGRAPAEYAPCANAAVSTPLDWLREVFQ